MRRPRSWGMGDLEPVRPQLDLGNKRGGEISWHEGATKLEICVAAAVYRSWTWEVDERALRWKTPMREERGFLMSEIWT